MVVQQWLQSEDIGSSEESTWLDSDDLELDWFSQSLHSGGRGACSTHYKKALAVAQHNQQFVLKDLVG